MNAQADQQQYINKLEYVIREQMSEIGKLRNEIKQLVDWVMGDKDALACLQSIYNSSTASEGNKVRAAAASLPFERPRLSVSVSVQGPAVLGNRLDAIKTISPPNVIDHS